MIGVLASVVGLALGVAAREGPERALRGARPRTAAADLVFATRTVVVSLLVGIVRHAARRARSRRSARRASPPIAAVREGATLPPGRLLTLPPVHRRSADRRMRSCCSATPVRRRPRHGPRLLSIAVGVLLLFVGVALISPGSCGRSPPSSAGRRSGSAGRPARCARRNAIRNPGRTAATAAALMIGIALVTFVAVLANGMKAVEPRTRSRTRSAPTASSPRRTATRPSSPRRATRPTTSRGAERDRRALGLGKVAGSSRYLTGIEPGTITTPTRSSGSRARTPCSGRWATNGAIVEKEFAEDKNLAVGDAFSLRVPSGKEVPLAGRRHLQAAAVLPAARHGLDPEGDVRHPLRPAAEPVHVRERRRSERPVTARAGARRRSRTRNCRRARSGSRAQDKEFNEFLICSTCCWRSR